MTQSSTDHAASLGAYPDLASKVAVVTGGSWGIGAATSHALAANGAAMAVVGRDQSAINATVEAIISEGGTALGVAADCTVEGYLEALRRQVDEELGPIDILAAFAGGKRSAARRALPT
jgi:3-oxoacyl-[acyl-carrier protein] reductase